jgi:hypothetical protein
MKKPERGLLSLLAVAATALGCGGETDNRPAEWAYISTVIIQPSCATANCHSALAARSNVDLSTIREGWRKLVGAHFVVAQCSQQSSMVHLLRGQGSRRMPPTFALAAADISLIERWIDAGAAYNVPGETAPVDPSGIAMGCASTMPPPPDAGMGLGTGGAGGGGAGTGGAGGGGS